MTPTREAAVRAAVDALVSAIMAAVSTAAPDGAPDRLLSIDEASAALSLGRSKVYGEIGAGRLASIKVGRRRLVPASAIASFVAERVG